MGVLLRCGLGLGLLAAVLPCISSLTGTTAARGTSSSTIRTSNKELPAPTAGQRPTHKIRSINLRTAPKESLRPIAGAFAEGFYSSEQSKPHIGNLLATLQRDKVESLHARFGQEENIEQCMPATMVYATTTHDDDDDDDHDDKTTILGCASVLGCVKVTKDPKGPRLLTGREAEKYRASTAQGTSPNPALQDKIVARARETALICDVAVIPSARRQGIGRDLCLACCTIAQEQGFHDIFLLVNEENKGARELYQSLGFAQDGLKAPAKEFVIELAEPRQHPTIEPRENYTLNTKDVVNILMGRPIHRSAKPFKLGAKSRKEEIQRKQLIGHIIPLVAAAALAAATQGNFL